MKTLIALLGIMIVGIGLLWLLFSWYGQSPANDPETYAQIEQIVPQSNENTPKVIPSEVGFDVSSVKPTAEVFITNRPQFKELLNTMYTDVYGVFPCTISSEDSQVVMFTAIPQGDSDAQYDAAIKAVRAWEPYIFMDIGAMIFGKERLPAVLGEIAFSPYGNTLYRRAQVSLSDGTGYIFTGWRLNFVFFADSESCLEEVMDTVYHFD